MTFNKWGYLYEPDEIEEPVEETSFYLNIIGESVDNMFQVHCPSIQNMFTLKVDIKFGRTVFNRSTRCIPTVIRDERMTLISLTAFYILFTRRDNE